MDSISTFSTYFLAAMAAPIEVVSTYSGILTGMPATSAWICMHNRLLTTPPSTLRLVTAWPMSLLKHCSTSFTCRQIASSALLQMWFEVWNCVRPISIPRASVRHYGANSPANAGTNTSPSLDDTFAAFVFISSHVLMISILSFSQLINTAHTAIDPSNPYYTGSFSPSLKQGVVNKPFLENIGSNPVLTKRNAPVP